MTDIFQAKKAVLLPLILGWLGPQRAFVVLLRLLSRKNMTGDNELFTCCRIGTSGSCYL